MISTISCELSKNVQSDILKATFPMGSMTGLKIKVMELWRNMKFLKEVYILDHLE